MGVWCPPAACACVHVHVCASQCEDSGGERRPQASATLVKAQKHERTASTHVRLGAHLIWGWINPRLSLLHGDGVGAPHCFSHASECVYVSVARTEESVSKSLQSVEWDRKRRVKRIKPVAGGGG